MTAMKIRTILIIACLFCAAVWATALFSTARHAAVLRQRDDLIALLYKSNAEFSAAVLDANRSASNSICAGTNLMGLATAAIESQQDRLGALEARLATLEAWQKAVTQPRAVAQSPRSAAAPAPPAGQMIDGVPADVVQRIRAEAERLYPNDFGLQVSQIEYELTSYRRLHPPK